MASRERARANCGSTKANVSQSQGTDLGTRRLGIDAKWKAEACEIDAQGSSNTKWQGVDWAAPVVQRCQRTVIHRTRTLASLVTSQKRGLKERLREERTASLSLAASLVGASGRLRWQPGAGATLLDIGGKWSQER